MSIRKNRKVLAEKINHNFCCMKSMKVLRLIRNYTEKIKITTAIEIQELKKTCLGANNGIIIGHTNFGGIVAYDRQCPNCIKNYI